MGVCIFCGKSAGFLSNKHKGCLEKHIADVKEEEAQKVRAAEAYKVEQSRITEVRQKAKDTITLAASQFIDDQSEASAVFNQIKKDAISAGITEPEYRHLIFCALNSFVVKALASGLIEIPICQRIMSLINLVGYDRNDIFHDENCPVLKVVKSNVLTNFNLGKVTPFFDVKTPTGINIDDNETVVWAFTDTQLYEDRIHSRKVGGSAGVSLKVHKGIYLHTGGFAAHTVSHVEEDFIDTGIALFTDKKIYFSGKHKGFKLAYKKVIHFEQYPGGIGIIKDGTSAKTLYLVTGDAWFTYNLANLIVQ